MFDGEEIVQVEKKAKKDDEECEKFEKAKVCISKHEDKGDGIYACQLAIDDMNEDLEGTCISIVWTTNLNYTKPLNIKQHWKNSDLSVILLVFQEIGK